MEGSGKETNQTLARGLEILRILNLGTQSVTEIARRAGLPRTSVNRALETLMAEGYIARDGGGRYFRPTAKVCELSEGFNEESWLNSVAEPEVLALADRVVWPLALAKPMGLVMSIRISTDHISPLSLEQFPAGTQAPLLFSSSGLVTVAWAPEAYTEVLLEMMVDMGDRERALLNDKERFLADLRKIREQGFTITPRVGANMASIAVPILVDDRCLATLAMRYLPSAVDDDAVVVRYLPQLREAANRIATGVQMLAAERRAGKAGASNRA